MRLLSVLILWMLWLRVFAATAIAQEVELGEPAPLVVTPRVAAAAPPALPAALASGEEAWAEIIRTTVIAALPEKTVEDKDWGHKSSVFSRYEIKTRKGRLSMRPRTKEVNHGFWQRYTVTMLKPQETLQLEFDNVQRVRCHQARTGIDSTTGTGSTVGSTGDPTAGRSRRPTVLILP